MAVTEHPASKVNEVTPLLSKGPLIEAPKYGKSVLYRALLCGFLVSLSFGVTQVPYALLLFLFPSHVVAIMLSQLLQTYSI